MYCCLNMLVQDIFHTMKIVDILGEWVINITAFLGTADSKVHIVHISPVILGEHHEKHEIILDLTITVSLLSLEASSSPLFLKPMQIFVKNVHNNYSTITFENIADISETLNKNVYYLIHREHTI